MGAFEMLINDFANDLSRAGKGLLDLYVSCKIGQEEEQKGILEGQAINRKGEGGNMGWDENSGTKKTTISIDREKARGTSVAREQAGHNGKQDGSEEARGDSFTRNFLPLIDILGFVPFPLPPFLQFLMNDFVTEWIKRINTTATSPVTVHKASPPPFPSPSSTISSREGEQDILEMMRRKREDYDFEDDYDYEQEGALEANDAGSDPNDF